MGGTNLGTFRHYSSVDPSDGGGNIFNTTNQDLGDKNVEISVRRSISADKVSEMNPVTKVLSDSEFAPGPVSQEWGKSDPHDISGRNIFSQNTSMILQDLGIDDNPIKPLVD